MSDMNTNVDGQRQGQVYNKGPVRPSSTGCSGSGCEPCANNDANQEQINLNRSPSVAQGQSLVKPSDIKLTGVNPKDIRHDVEVFQENYALLKETYTPVREELLKTGMLPEKADAYVEDMILAHFLP